MDNGQTRVAACFWEEHCTECGEPACYRTCSRYARGRGGRCRRFEGGLDETMLCEGVEVSFLPWGKMEAYFHGGMISSARARALERLMRRTMWLRRLFPRWWRSWRWRWTMRGAERAAPNVWRVRVVAERDGHLTLQVVGPDLKEVCRDGLPLKAHEATETELRVPPVGDGALFRLFPTDGEATGRIRFEYNVLQHEAGPEGRPPVKCVAWDLDGTLWEGTLSEVGVEGVRLNPEAVRLVRELDARGIVSSVASRNDPEQALAALRTLGLAEYFVFPQIGWGPKSESLRTLAREMNIGLDAIAFIDDREEVRGEVRMNAPEVRVLEKLSEVAALEGSQGLGPARRLAYRAEMSRRQAQAASGVDHAAFLAASGLEFELLPVEGDRGVRCRELLQRTNQLNLTGRRYDESAFERLLETAVCQAVRVWDKYGDYGIVGFVAVRERHLVECCFSCRVAEKGIERRVLERIAAGRPMTADVMETPRNAKIREIVREFLA